MDHPVVSAMEMDRGVNEGVPEVGIKCEGEGRRGVRAPSGKRFRPWSRPDERSGRKNGPNATHEKDVRTVFSVRNDDVV